MKNLNGKPPYTISEKAADYLAKIVETATRLSYGTVFLRDIKLHRENRLRTIHSSLAIEGNALSLGEVTAVIEGKVVAGKQEDVKEVKNAYEAYDRMMTFSPYSTADFLKAHKLVTQGLVSESGKFRSGDVGVFDGDIAVHMGARPQFVLPLMKDLFHWAKSSDLHPVLKSAILQYEVETIHPFSDGNGRMGRLWQTLILVKWNPIFAWIPMEAVLYQNREQYYQAIQDSRKANDSGIFIEYTLSALYQMLVQQEMHQSEYADEHQDKHQDKHQEDQREKHWDEFPAEMNEAAVAVLKSIGEKALSRKEIFIAIGMYGDSRSFKRNISPLITDGFIEMTIPDKPNSKQQKYRLTEKGLMFFRRNML